MSINHTENPKEFWKTVLGEVQVQVSPMVFQSFMTKTRIDGVTNESINILCDSEFVKSNVEKRYAPIIEEAVRKIAQRELKMFVAIDHKSREQTESEPKTAKETAKLENSLGPLFNPQKGQDEILKDKQEKSNLSPKFTFENYIMGKNNNLAYAIATAVAERPGELYNPVFIYSSVGLGKTHMLQAIGNQILKTKPGTKVIYSTGEAFTNELIMAIQSGHGKGRSSTSEFRTKFRKADVFLIDDVQFIIGRDATQEEFFHTFNDLYMAQKQIVITSDRPPKEFNDLAARITSRFASGIIVDIQAPDIETRAAILRNKRDWYKDTVPNNVIDLIAEKVPSNIRELEGAYMQVITYARANGLEVTLESASIALGQALKDKPGKIVNVNQILKAVCTYYSVKMPDIKGQSRVKTLVIPRQVAMYLMKEMTKTPYTTIGQFLGGRDHTTIIHGVDKVTAEVNSRGKMSQDVQNVIQSISVD